MAMTDDLIPPELTLDEHEPFPLDVLDVLLDADDEPADELMERWESTDESEIPPDQLEVVRWEITSDDLAEWAMAHVAQIDAGVALLDEQRRARIARINRWHATSVRRLTQRRGFFAAHLVRYAAAFRARDPKRNKTLHLTNGTVKSSEAQPKIVVQNPATVIRWAVENMATDDLLAILKDDVLVSELRKRTKIIVRPIGYEVTLECGHVHHVPVLNTVDDSVRTPEQLRADGMPCDQCDLDPIDGYVLQRVTAVADWDERVAVMPVTPSKAAGAALVPTTIDVDGAGIDPGGVTFTVKPS